MKYQVTRFKNLHLALKELKPFILDGEHLQTGKRFKRFGGLCSRELLVNWLLCVAIDQDKLTFTSDPVDSDGIIFNETTGETYLTEHVLVPNNFSDKNKSVEELILDKINQKRSKGAAAYASGKTLVVFINYRGGEWHPNRVAKMLPEPLYFQDVWVVGLYCVDGEGRYVYGVTKLDLRHGDAPVCMVCINKDFDGWDVVRIQ